MIATTPDPRGLLTVPEQRAHLCYIIGEPGTGKTTLAEYLTEGLSFEETDHPVPFRRYDCGVVELGRRRPGGFSGTDALAMNIQPAVVAFLEGVRPRLLFAEGDRLANDKFFAAAEAMGYVLSVYQLWGPKVAETQRSARGSQQDPSWLAGRATKVKGLRQRWNGLVLPAGAPLAELAARMDDEVSRVLRKATRVEASV